MNIVVLSNCLLVALLVNGLSGRIAETYTARAGPYTIQATSDEKIEFNTDLSPIAHNDYIACDVNMDVGDSKYKIEIQDYVKR